MPSSCTAAEPDRGDTQDVGAFVQLSGVLKRIAVQDSPRVCNDLRLLSSRAAAPGLGEINLPARCRRAPRIMPGKVNPVIPEVVNQIAFEVIGNDITITLASRRAGQLQLNAFEPIIAWSLFKSHCPLACRAVRRWPATVRRGDHGQPSELLAAAGASLEQAWRRRSIRTLATKRGRASRSDRHRNRTKNRVDDSWCWNRTC